MRTEGDSERWANPEHLHILMQGVEVWNQWRDQHRDIRPNLGGADLTGTKLTGAYLGGADLTRGRPHRDRSRPRPTSEGANLTKADLSDVILDETVFGDTKLTAVRGLETCNHYGPSTFDHRTIALLRPTPLGFSPGLWPE